jgi:hypothetical protein
LFFLLIEQNLDKEKIFQDFAEKTLWEFAFCKSEDCVNKYNNDIFF